MRPGVIRSQVQSFPPGGNGCVELLLLRQLDGNVEEPIELGGGCVDSLKAVRRDVDKLGNIHGAICRGCVLES